MLKRLMLKNLATIASLTVEFGAGMTALTGETGAGKSMLIGGLELALGERASADRIREGENLAVAEAEFHCSPERFSLNPWQDVLDWDATEPLVLRREISRQGRSRCFVNDQLVTVQQLKEIGEWLVDLHGQHEHQSLFNLDAQRGALDDFGGHGDLCDAYRKSWENWHQLARRQRELESASADFERQRDFLQFEYDEIEKVDPQAGEVDALRQREALLAQADALREAALGGYATLYEGSDECPSVLGQLRKLTGSLEPLVELTPKLGEAVERLESVRVELADLADLLQQCAEEGEEDPEALETTIKRLESLKALMRKHGGTEASLLTARERLRAELDGMSHNDREREEIGAQLSEAWAQVEKDAGKLGKARAKAARALEKAVGPLLGQLCMEQARFEIACKPCDKPTQHGAEQIEFLLAANPGLPLAPLRKVASGGELSRVMLAIKTALAGRDQVATLVFDEVDAGISGEATQRVGLLLAQLGAMHQVLVITHHAPIAALAGAQQRISKRVKARDTFTQVDELTREERLDELARMMEGDRAGDAARELVRQWLDSTA